MNPYNLLEIIIHLCILKVLSESFGCPHSFIILGFCWPVGLFIHILYMQGFAASRFALERCASCIP